MVIIARCPVFDDYLNKANELHQKLLIEIKPVEKIVQIWWNALWKNMEQILSRMDHQMQSLDYHVIDQV